MRRLSPINCNRSSRDSHVNQFGNKLLSLCKENSLLIVNGRLEPGHFTCFNCTRGSSGASVVDYVIVNFNLLSCISSFKVNDLTSPIDLCRFSTELFKF